jgi:FkbM family methyltransferase
MLNNLDALEHAMNGWKASAVTLLRTLGWDISKYNVYNSEWLRLIETLRLLRVTTTLDVGANTGQFANQLRRTGFRGRIVSFEPLLAAHARLSQRASRDIDWIVAPRLALGECEGVLKINVAANSVSSSLLPMLDRHIRAEPASRYIGEEPIRCARLDEVAAPFVKPDDVIFIKLDVQGYERQVLAGAENLLSRTRCVRMELSLTPLYRDQALYSEMIQWMESNRFVLWGFEPAFVDPNNGRMLQVDALFCRLESHET